MSSPSSENNFQTKSENSELEEIRKLLCNFDLRLKQIEDNSSGFTSPSDSQASAGNIAATVDIHKECPSIRDSLARIALPPELKVQYSPVGIKQELRHSLSIISKSSKYTETALKLISTFEKSHNGDTYSVQEEDIHALFTILSASSQFFTGRLH